MSELAIVLAVIILAGAFGGVVSVTYEYRSALKRFNEGQLAPDGNDPPPPIEPTLPKLRDFGYEASVSIAGAIILLLVIEIMMNGLIGVWKLDPGLLLSALGDAGPEVEGADYSTFTSPIIAILTIILFAFMGGFFAHPVLDLTRLKLIRSAEKRLGGKISKVAGDVQIIDRDAKSRDQITRNIAAGAADIAYAGTNATKNAPSEFSNDQDNLLNYLRKNEGQKETIISLSAALGIRESAVRKAVEELKQSRYIKIEADKENGLVELSPRGYAMLTVKELIGKSS